MYGMKGREVRFQRCKNINVPENGKTCVLNNDLKRHQENRRVNIQKETELSKKHMEGKKKVHKA